MTWRSRSIGCGRSGGESSGGMSVSVAKLAHHSVRRAHAKATVAELGLVEEGFLQVGAAAGAVKG